MRTITDITTDHTASAHRGTGAATTIHGTGMHGHITALGDSTDGITAAGAIHGIMEDSTTLGITEAHGVSMTHGTMEDGAHTIHTMQDGTAASDGTLIITTIIITQAMSQEVHQTRITSEARDIRPVLKDLLQAEAALCEAEQASEAA